jgi:hypothetical protein
MKSAKLILFTILTSLFCLSAFQLSAQNQTYQIDVNSGQYDQVVRQADQSGQGISVQELSRIFGENMSASTNSESNTARITLMLIDQRRSVLNRDDIQVQTSQQAVRLGQMINTSDIQGIFQVPGNQWVPGCEWFPGSSWITQSAQAQSSNGIQREAMQLATRALQSSGNQGSRGVVLAFAYTPDSNQFSNASSYLAVFPLWL